MPASVPVLFRRACALGVLVLLAALCLPTYSTRAAGGITVNTTSDASDPNDGKCSIREALQAVFNNDGKPVNECAGASSPAAVTISAPGPITLNGGTLPTIRSIVTITGPAIIQGDGNSPSLKINSDGILNIAAMTFTKGRPAILNNGGIVNIAGSTFNGNSSDGNGAAIDSSGKLNIAGSAFSGNTSNGPNGGGAIYMSGSATLAIAGSAFNGNVAKRSGGAIYASAPAVLIDTVFNGNIAKGDDPNGDGTDNANDDHDTVGGGAIFSANDSTDGRKLRLTRVVFNGNIAPNGNGGAIYTGATATTEIEDSSFQGNLAGTPPSTNRRGGALATFGGKVRITGSVLMNNGVVGDGGAIANDRKSELTLANTALVANAATGKGGGVANMNSMQASSVWPQLTARNTTFNLNVANDSGGALFNQNNASANLANTIVAGSDGANLGGNCAGTITSQGHNLDSGTTCAFPIDGSVSGADPKLDVPSFNGGPLSSLLTQKLQAGSPAIDAGDPALCAASPVNNQDQRGKSRPNDGDGNGSAICDIGAFESETLAAGYGSQPVQPGPIDLGSATVGATADGSFTIFETGNTTLNVSSGSFSGANAGDFSVLSGLPATIADGGSEQVVTLRCKPSALGERTAKLTLTTNDMARASITYDVRCTGTPQPNPAFVSEPGAPGPLDLGSAVVGTQISAPLTVKEAGNAPLAITAITFSGANAAEFSAPGFAAFTLADSAPPKDVVLACTPSAPGIRSATATITTNDPLRTSVSFDLSCTGKQPAVPVLSGPGVNIGNAIVDGNNGPYGLAISPDGKNVYSADDGDGIVTVFGRDSNGALFFQSGVQDGLGGANDLAGSIMSLVSPNGMNVYVASAIDDAVTTFKRDPQNGNLTYVDRIKKGDTYGICLPPNPCSTLAALDGAYGLAISPDGRYLYASSINDSRIIVLRRDESDGSVGLGAFEFPVQVYQDTGKLSEAYGLALSPDGTTLYATGYDSDTLLVFKRNASNGTISLSQELRVADAASLNGAFRVTVSPDGAYVYTASWQSNAITAFKRNPADGKLTFQASYIDGQNGIDGLQRASSVTVSADGLFLYATGYSDQAVAVFSRNPTTGVLQFEQAIKRNAGGQPPLAGARDVIVSPDGSRVFATGHIDNRIVSIPRAHPAPTLISLAPASATAGSGPITLVVNGQDFVQGAIINWNGANLPTTFVNSGQLKATLDAALLTNPATRPVKVINPGPGGGDSNSLSFTITPPNENPVPSLTRLDPPGAAAGGPAFTLTVVGANFINGSTVQWNGTSRPTTFVSATTLQAEISAGDIDQPGVAAVTVVTSGPGGGTSNALPFKISEPGKNPVPVIRRLTPPSATKGSVEGEITVVIAGANFMPDAQANWNGEPRTTTYVKPDELHMAISAADLAVAGVASVTVTNPAPGGGESNVTSFTIGDVGDNPVPVLNSYSITPTSGGFTVTLLGEGFVSGATVQWNGISRPANIASATQASVNITTSEFARGSSVVSLANPAPGGGQSNDMLVGIHRLFMPLVRK